MREERNRAAVESHVTLAGAPVMSCLRDLLLTPTPCFHNNLKRILSGQAEKLPETDPIWSKSAQTPAHGRGKIQYRATGSVLGLTLVVSLWATELV